MRALGRIVATSALIFVAGCVAGMPVSPAQLAAAAAKTPVVVSRSTKSCVLRPAQLSRILGIRLTRLHTRRGGSQGTLGCAYNNGAGYDDITPPAAGIVHYSPGVHLSSRDALGIHAHDVPGLPHAKYASASFGPSTKSEAGQCPAPGGGSWLVTVDIRRFDIPGLLTLLRRICAR